MQDEVRFIRYHQFGIEQSPLQIYTLLNFTPHRSVTREIYKSEAPDWFALQQGVNEYWNPCILTLEGHTKTVVSVAFSHDGRLLASGSLDRTVKIWDVSTGGCLHTLLGHDHHVSILAFSPKNYNLATGSYDKTIKIWDADNGALIRTLRCHRSTICALTFSKNGKLMASSAEDGTIKLFDMPSGKCTRELIINDGMSNARSIAFTHDGQILSCGTDGSVLIWDLWDQTEPHQIEIDEVDFPPGSVVSSQTNELFFIRGHNVEVWNPATKMRIRTIRYPTSSLIHRVSYGLSVILSRHGTILGVIGVDEVDILNPSTLNWVAQIKQGSLSSSVSPTSDILALALGLQINIWDLSTITNLNHPSPTTDTRPVFSSNTSLVVTQSDTEMKLIIWRSCIGDSTSFTRPWHVIQIVPPCHQDRQLALKSRPMFSFDGQMLILQYHKEIHIMHVSEEGVGFKVSFPESHYGVLALSHDNRWLAVPFFNHVSIFEFGNPFAETKLDTNDDWWELAVCSFSHDSKTLAVHHGSHIDLYENNTWRRNYTLYNVEREGLQDRTVFFSSDDRFLATTSHDVSRRKTELNVWDLETKVCSRLLYSGYFKPLNLEVSTFLQLETNLGTFQFINEKMQRLVPPKYAISLDSQWILEGSERLIWLPPDYRPKWAPDAEFRFCRICSKFKFAITTTDRRLVILTLP